MLKIAISDELQISKDIEIHLSHSGLSIDFRDRSKSISYSDRFPSEIRYLDNNHIFISIANGLYDLAIVNDLSLCEQEKDYEKLYVFEEASSSLCFFFANGVKYKDVLSLSNKRIATNVPETVKRYCKSKRIRGTTIIFDKAPQNAVELGIADCFVDLAKNTDSKQYYMAEVIMETHLVLIASPKISLEKRHIFVDELIYRLQAVQNARNKIKVEILCSMENKNKLVAEIRKIDENIIVLSSYDQQKVSIQAVMDEKQLWDITHYLKEIKAEKIIVYDITKMII
jgi:hypothetical protein